jgi:hypothetical protein
VSTLLKLLLLPMLTGSAYCLAYAYELGYFDSLGIPATLLTVELGQLAIPGLLGVGTVLLIGLVYKTHVEIMDQGSFTSQAYLWLPFFVLAQLLWPDWGVGLVTLLFLQRQAAKSQQRWLWEGAAWLWASALVRDAVPDAYDRTISQATGMILFLIVFERWSYWRVLTLNRQGKVPSRLVKFFADFRAPARNSVRTFASGEGPELYRSVIAASIGLGMLLILVFGSYRLGYYFGQQQEYYLVVDQTSKSPRIVARQYGDKAIEGSLNANTLELTGEWRMIKYSDTNPMVAVYKKLGHLKHQDYPSPEPLDAIYRGLKSHFR